MYFFSNRCIFNMKVIYTKDIVVTITILLPELMLKDNVTYNYCKIS